MPDAIVHQSPGILSRARPCVAGPGTSPKSRSMMEKSTPIDPSPEPSPYANWAAEVFFQHDLKFETKKYQFTRLSNIRWDNRSPSINPEVIPDPLHKYFVTCYDCEPNSILKCNDDGCPHNKSIHKGRVIRIDVSMEAVKQTSLNSGRFKIIPTRYQTTSDSDTAENKTVTNQQELMKVKQEIHESLQVNADKESKKHLDMWKQAKQSPGLQKSPVVKTVGKNGMPRSGSRKSLNGLFNTLSPSGRRNPEKPTRARRPGQSRPGASRPSDALPRRKASQNEKALADALQLVKELQGRLLTYEEGKTNAVLQNASPPSSAAASAAVRNQPPAPVAHSPEIQQMDTETEETSVNGALRDGTSSDGNAVPMNNWAPQQNHPSRPITPVVDIVNPEQLGAQTRPVGGQQDGDAGGALPIQVIPFTGLNSRILKGIKVVPIQRPANYNVLHPTMTRAFP